jgi:hypothetical protein
MTARPVTPLWPRPRGQRKIPPARQRAPRDPYGAEHRKIRAALLAQLAAIGGAPCPLCGEAMFAWMGRRLHLHHSRPGDKLLGLPGDTLVHARCNVSSGGREGAAITNRGTVTEAATVTDIRTVTVRPSRQW